MTFLIWKLVFSSSSSEEGSSTNAAATRCWRADTPMNELVAPPPPPAAAHSRDDRRDAPSSYDDGCRFCSLAALSPRMAWAKAWWSSSVVQMTGRPASTDTLSAFSTLLVLWSPPNDSASLSMSHFRPEVVASVGPAAGGEAEGRQGGLVLGGGRLPRLARRRRPRQQPRTPRPES